MKQNQTKMKKLFLKKKSIIGLSENQLKSIHAGFPNNVTGDIGPINCWCNPLQTLIGATCNVIN